MTFDTTARMARIDTAQQTADAERLALIADSLEHLGYGRPDSVRVGWYRGQDSGLPLVEVLILPGEKGEVYVKEDLSEPAQQELLALLESRFDSNLDEGEMTFDLKSAPPAPTGMTEADLNLLREVAADIEEQERTEALAGMTPPDHTRSEALKALIAQLDTRA